MLKPRSTATRELVSLDGLWRFALDGGPGPLDTTLEAAVPASYNDLFTDSAIRDHVGWAWYQRQVRVPRGWAGERVVLRVDAATHQGRVYVDDALVAEHVGGYTPFEADITEHVRAEFADRHGIVVIDETAAVGLNLAVASGLTGAPPRPTFSPDTFGEATREAHAQAIRELVARDKNHPSVVMWCIANEPASNEEGAREYFEPLVELTRKLDPTRPVSYAAVLFATHDNDRIADLFDVLCINRYYGWYVATGDLATAETYLEHDLRGWAGRFGKPIMMSEYGADTMPGLHSVWDTPWTEEYQQAYLEMNHRVFDRVEAFVGEHVWNFADFQTSHGIHRVDGNKKGVFTRDRRPKAAAHALRARWRSLGGRKPQG
ncbi:glycoside hydrolase family 2 TIM barrel-domain containing protein [Nonomuraea jabiensis]|uniref:glycoside hydrolase family 2 TIM barrel-domain containing protein n=1 Tax=Nonomuraea jabiensis TaxID=882448 RepID=UPI00368514E0